MECGREIKNDLSCIRKGWQRRRRHREKPFQTITEAAKIACAGDEVLVAPGVYREYVNPVNGGTGEDAGLFTAQRFRWRR